MCKFDNFLNVCRCGAVDIWLFWWALFMWAQKIFLFTVTKEYWENILLCPPILPASMNVNYCFVPIIYFFKFSLNYQKMTVKLYNYNKLLLLKWQQSFISNAFPWICWCMTHVKLSSLKRQIIKFNFFIAFFRESWNTKQDLYISLSTSIKPLLDPIASSVENQKQSILINFMLSVV